MRKIMIPAEHVTAIRREIAGSDSAPAARILDALRGAVRVVGGFEIEISDVDAVWAEMYIGAAPIIGKFAHAFASPEPRPGNEEVLRDVFVEIGDGIEIERAPDETDDEFAAAQSAYRRLLAGLK